MKEASDRETLRTLLFVGACWAAVSLLAASPARAIIDDSNPGAQNCNLPRYQFKLSVTPAIVGLPIANSQVQVNATNAKLEATGLTANDVCDTFLFQISQFQWSVIPPQGQNATITEGNSLAPKLRLGGPGLYTMRLVACPNKCTVRLDGRSKSVGPFISDTRLTADTDITVPPETEHPAQEVLPLAPANPPIPSFSYSQRNTKCLGGGGVKDPQWVTAEDFTGPASYRLLEGPVTWSKVADLDNPLNHDSQDFEWKNRPDLPYAGLPQPTGGEQMKVEWESGRYPRIFNPTPGDRTSTFGFWILDCGHDPFKGEIHPPVGVATHRARPIHIPPTFRAPGFPNGFGQNVFVPGIASDLWFNRRSGETTRNCSRTGLHNPAKRIQVQGSPTPISQKGKCIKEPHPLGRTFTYNIYLPRNPQLRARELGMDTPPVPLFIGTEKFSQGGGGPEPVIRVREVNGVTWLEVTVDLRGLQGDTYGRRISAGWAYPSPDNWGASRWRVFLDDMYIYSDAEPPGDDGDWRVFFNTNNRDLEWSKIIDCDGCVDDDERRKLDLSTGPGGKLGPDTVVFPGQPIFVHVVGYDDEVAGDDLGSVFDRVPQKLGSYSTLATNGEAAYRLQYRIRPAGPFPRPTLTQEAGALFAAYTGKPNPNCQPTLAPTAAAAQRNPGAMRAPFCAPAQQDPGLAMTDHPDNLVLRQPSLRLRKVEFDETMEEEEFALTGISTSGLRRVVNSLSERERGVLFKEVRQELDGVPKRRRDKVNELVTSFDRALSDDLFRQAVPGALRK